MKTLIRILLILFIVVIAGIGALLAYVETALPDVNPAPELTIEITPERVARGAYLAHSVSACMDCHSTRAWNKFSGPLVEGTLGKGGEEFNRQFGFPGRFTAKNITPFGIGDWTDGEVYRAITSGVSRDGSPLFPVMPYLNYGQMDKEDTYAIIAYIRTLDPIEHEIAESEADFPINFILNTIPENPSHQPIPDTSDQVLYGAYLLNAAGCSECHTPQDKGTPVPGLTLAGGFEFKMPPFGTVRSANITPDKRTGIGNWTEELFVNRFKAYADSSYVPADVEAGEFQTVMPWTMYAKMKEKDLKAIFAYLKTVEPVEHEVIRFTPL